MTKLQKAKTALNDRFREILPKRFYEKFNIEIVTSWSLFDMALRSHRVDGIDFTQEQLAFIVAFELGYGSAMEVVNGMDS